MVDVPTNCKLNYKVPAAVRVRTNRQAQTVVANFSVATNTRWKDKVGIAQESVEWHRCEAWNKLGELAGQLLKKGSAIHLEGRLKTKKWSDDSGAEHFTTRGVGRSGGYAALMYSPNS